MDFRELRTNYLSFMKSRGYTYSEPDTLLAFEFPYTFTPSGAVNYYWKMIHTPEKSENPTSCQRVFRHWDTQEVGDGRHLSFFEMIGTWSFNGFVREKVLRDHFEFATQRLQLDPARIYATVFSGEKVFAKNVKGDDPFLLKMQSEGINIDEDSEAKKTWRKFGIRDNHILSVGEEEAFLINTTEPFAAYRTELFYDLSPDESLVTKEVFLAHPERFLEFFVSLHEKWIKHNLVSSDSLANPTQDQGSFLQSVRPRIYPAAFGLERLSMIVAGVNNIFEIEPFMSLKRVLSQSKAGIPDNVIFKIIDVVRGILFLVADGAGEIRRAENKQRVHIYREHLKRLISLAREIGCDRTDCYRSLFKVAIECHVDHYSFIKGELEPCLEEVEKQKQRMVQEEKEKKKHESRIAKRNAE